MKRYCKNCSIHNPTIINEAARLVLAPNKDRSDVRKLMEEYGSIEGLTANIREELLAKRLTFVPIWHREKVDSSSGKIRTIGIQNAKHQIYDKIAVLCLEEMTPYIGEHQYARKGKSPERGIHTISRWMRDREIAYVAKLDVRKCYESISQEHVMRFLRKHVKNCDLLWLIETMIESYGGRLSIGSHLSQLLCDLFLAQIYHAVSERMYSERRGKRINWVRHVAFYRDDFLLLGTSAKNIHRTVDAVIRMCDNLGLAIKPSWRVYKVPFQEDKDALFADIMGYRAYRHHVTVRKTTFKRVRRVYLRANRHKHDMTIKLARRTVSYYGKLKHTDSYNFQKRTKAYAAFKTAKKVVSNYDRGNLRQAPGERAVFSQ